MKRPTVKKMTKSRPWTKEDISMLKTLARQREKTRAIARQLKRTVRGTYQKAVKLGVKLVGSQKKKA